jgi:hypothetical protein
MRSLRSLRWEESQLYQYSTDRQWWRGPKLRIQKVCLIVQLISSRALLVLQRWAPWLRKSSSSRERNLQRSTRYGNRQLISEPWPLTIGCSPTCDSKNRSLFAKFKLPMRRLTSSLSWGKFMRKAALYSSAALVGSDSLNLPLSFTSRDVMSHDLLSRDPTLDDPWFPQIFIDPDRPWTPDESHKARNLMYPAVLPASLICPLSAVLSKPVN